MKTPYNALAVLILGTIDMFFHGYCLKIKDWKLGIIFWTLEYKGMEIYPVYRTMEFLLNVYALYLVYQWSGIYALLGMLLAFYFHVKDVVYYIELGKIQEVIDMEKTDTKTYWLTHFFQAGYWLFRKGFKAVPFFVSALIGLVISILSNYFRA